MEVYTLDREFRAKDPIDKTETVIWTEKYGEAGNVVITVEDNAENRAKVPMGTFVASTDSNEVMLIETRTMENGIMKLEGDTITGFLKNRALRASGYWNSQSADFPQLIPGQALAALVYGTCIHGPFTATEFPWFGLNGYRQVIHNLSLGEVDGTDPIADFNFQYGPLYDACKTIAETYSLGFKMYLEYANDQGYSLKFTVYKGKDRTSTGPDPDHAVIFSPALDTLSDTKVVESMVGYKNVCYAYATQWTTPSYTYGMGEAFAPGFNPATMDFDRRVMMIFCDDMAVPEGWPTENQFGQSVPPGDPPPGTLLPALNARARDALANNNYTRLVDGEVVPQDGHVFGADYFLGDIVELSAGDNIPGQKARITEYIRTKDKDGERAYPTVSVLD